MALDIKKILSDAIISLSEEKPLSKITVGDIIKRSGTSRQTFYNHFLDKNDLITWIYRVRAMSAFSNLDQGLKKSITQAQNDFLRYRQFYAQACEITGTNSLREYMYEYCVNIYTEYISKNFGKDELNEELDFSIRFYSFGVSSMLAELAANNLKVSPSNKVLYIINCMPPVLKKYFQL